MIETVKTPPRHVADNEDGSVLLLALFMLFAVTMLGFFSTNTSTIETHATANNAYYKKAFYAAEAGLEHARVNLENLLLARNGARVAGGNKPVWNFALINQTPDDETDDATLCDNGRPCFSETDDPETDDPRRSVRLFNSVPFGDCTYSVYVWDDWDSDEGAAQIADADANSRIYIRSVATGPRGASASVEMILEGDVREEEIRDYTAQSGAGAAKLSTGGDKDAINDFTTQASNLGT